MSNPRLFFALGALLVVLLPPLIYSRFALALSFYWKPQTQRKTLFIDFTPAPGVSGDYARYRPDPRQTVSENPPAYGGPDRGSHQRHLSHLGWSEPSGLGHPRICGTVKAYRVPRTLAP